jgi:hypothetical protein
MQVLGISHRQAGLDGRIGAMGIIMRLATASETCARHGGRVNDTRVV